MADSRPRRQRRGSRAITRDTRRVDQQTTPTFNHINYGYEFRIPADAEVTGVIYDDIVRTPFPPNNNHTEMLTAQVLENTRFRLMTELNQPLRWTPPVGDPLAYPGPEPPSANDRLCCEIIDGNGNNLSLALLEESYHQAMSHMTFIENSECDYLWMGHLTYIDVRELIVQMMPRAIEIRLADDLGLRFHNAIIMHHQSIPEGEIIFWHSDRRFKSMDRRLIDIIIQAH